MDLEQILHGLIIVYFEETKTVLFSPYILQRISCDTCSCSFDFDFNKFPLSSFHIDLDNSKPYTLPHFKSETASRYFYFRLKKNYSKPYFNKVTFHLSWKLFWTVLSRKLKYVAYVYFIFLTTSVDALQLYNGGNWKSRYWTLFVVITDAGQ